MFLSDILQTTEGRKLSALSQKSTTYNAYYAYWREQLFERVMRLFVWENTGEVKPKEIEQRLILAGHVGITRNIKNKKQLLAMFGSFHGVTEYQDEWKKYIVRCPLFAKERTIGTDVVVINNNSLRNSTYELVHHYATLIAHTEVTLVMALVAARDSGGVPVAGTEKQKSSIENYMARLYNGQFDVVTDLGMLGVEYAGSDRKTAQDIMKIMETREKLIKSFFSDIGVRSAFEKRNNTIMAEVEADTSLLVLNLSDMLTCREKGAEEVNKMFNTNWSVHIAKEIDYATENERVAFDTHTEVHTKGDDENAEATKS